MPSPASALIRCSIVAMRTLSRPMVVAMRVSTTASAASLMSTGGSRSTRRNTMPVSAAAGRSTRVTLVPLCSPIPTARTSCFRVRCFSMALFYPSPCALRRAFAGRGTENPARSRLPSPPARDRVAAFRVPRFHARRQPWPGRCHSDAVPGDPDRRPVRGVRVACAAACGTSAAPRPRAWHTASSSHLMGGAHHARLSQRL